VLQDEAEHALAGAAVEVEYGEGLAGDFAGHFTKGQRRRELLVAEIVIERALLTRATEAMAPVRAPAEAVLAEFANGGVQDAVACLVGAVVRAFAHSLTVSLD